ncbi:T9SS type A sorting domain-containing protein [Empedobacter brevis]|uniref:T9SS type A sorting domain-containing protein n=1 Tax=Empedobacter brevis TaxID=247 RepID=UPI0028ACF7E3|nr:T9SS type A sorting domain-containing protein [Empedobacter brevis]
MNKLLFSALLSTLSLSSFAQEQKISFEVEEGYYSSVFDTDKGWNFYGDNSNSSIWLTNDKASDGKKSVRFSYYSTNSSANGKWNGVMYKLPDYNHFSISVDVNADALNRSDYNFLKLTNIQGFNYSTVGSFTFLKNGRIQVNGYLLNDKYTWIPTRWYNLKCEVNLNTKLVKYFANDELIASLPISDNTITKINELSFETNNLSSSSETEFYFDNVVIKNLENLSTDELKKKEIKIYPNPVQDVLRIQTTEKINFVEFFDLTGKSILKSTEKTINTKGLTKGLYIVKVNTTSQEISQKIIKK